MKTEKFITVTISFPHAPSASDPQRPPTCLRWGAITGSSPIAYELQTQISKVLSHFISRKMRSL